jgi:hypothetical protein
MDVGHDAPVTSAGEVEYLKLIRRNSTTESSCSLLVLRSERCPPPHTTVLIGIFHLWPKGKWALRGYAFPDTSVFKEPAVFEYGN